MELNEAALALELRRLAAEVAETSEAFARLERRLLSTDDRTLGGIIVPLAAEVAGGARFAVGELVQAAHARRDAVGQALVETMVEGDLLDSDGGFRSLGRLLRRIQGVAFAGYRVVADGQCWRIVAVSER